MRSLDPAVLDVAGDTKKTLPMAAGGTAEVRFDVRAKTVGRARIQMTTKLLGETDAFEEAIPVEVLVTPVLGHAEYAAPTAYQRFQLLDFMAKALP